jgi:hypothetical protein
VAPPTLAREERGGGANLDEGTDTSVLVGVVYRIPSTPDSLPVFKNPPPFHSFWLLADALGIPASPSPLIDIY